MKFCPHCRCWFNDVEFVAGDCCCSVCRVAPEALHPEPDPAELVFPYEATCTVCQEAYVEDGNNYDSSEDDVCTECREKPAEFPWRKWNDDVDTILVREGVLRTSDLSAAESYAACVAASKDYQAFFGNKATRVCPPGESANVGLGENVLVVPKIGDAAKECHP